MERYLVNCKEARTVLYNAIMAYGRRHGECSAYDQMCDYLRALCFGDIDRAVETRKGFGPAVNAYLGI